MKRALRTLLILGIAAGAIFGTRAFFSDTETSSNNRLVAGDLDLKVDNTSYYNGVFNQGTSWLAADLIDGAGPSTDGAYRFFDFDDIKPGDWGEDTISLHVETNDAWGCYEVTLTSNDDNTCTEPEISDDTCTEPNQDRFDGELAGSVEIAFWVDDGDNVYEEGESLITQGLISEALPGLKGALADSVNGILGLGGQPMIGDQVYYVAKAWCFGDLTLNQVPDDAKTGPDVRNSGLLCDGEALNNATQTDVLTADINFYVEQARNNENFVCTGERPTPTTGPTFTPTPTQTACIDDADVMLVLDRSGSISNTELASLKTAANDFVTALNPGVAGAHVGQSSFATLASLDLHLSDNASTIQAAINALDNGGFTNLVGGLQLASTELDDVGGDGHDRADATSPDYYVVVTDGNPNRPLPEANARTLAANEAAAIAAGGGTVFVVGVGSDVDATYLRDEIASAPANYFSVADYSQLQTALGQIVTTCNGTVN